MRLPSPARSTHAVEMANKARKDAARAKALQAAVEAMARHGPRRVGSGTAARVRRRTSSKSSKGKGAEQEPRAWPSRVVQRSEL
eukprot:COSAG04_NODE_532_length_12964_cov_6.010494_9_plen_84_part_00